MMESISLQPVTSVVQDQLGSLPSSRFSSASQSANQADVPTSSSATESVLSHEPRSAEQMAEIISQLNEQLTSLGMSVRFGVDEMSNRNFFSIEDSVSGEQVRQIPAEEILSVSRNLTQFLETNLYARMGQTESSFAPGLLTDQQA